MNMRDRFDKFTERARRVLSYAQEEAQRLGHRAIGTEHLLLGLVRDPDGLAARLLRAQGVEPDALRAAVERHIGRGEGAAPGLGQIGLTPRAKQVIELAVDEARRLNHHYVGTEHLLLGMLRQGDGIAVDVLRELGVNLDATRARLAALLGTPDGGAGRPGGGIRRPGGGPPGGPFGWLRRGARGPGLPGEPRLDNLTGRARSVLRLAREEAQGFNHNYVGTEHLLLGLIREGDGLGAQVLRGLGVELERVRRAVEFIIGRGDRMVLGEVGLTPRAKRVVALAQDEAARMGEPRVGTDHLLLGLVREGEGIAAGVLESLGVRMDRAREETLRLLVQRGGRPEDDGPDGDAGGVGNPPAEPRTDNLTRRAQAAMQLSQEEARRLQHDHVGAEHLLLGLMREGDGLGAQALRRLGVADLERVRREVESVVGRGDHVAPGELALSPRAATAVALAQDEAARKGRPQVGTAHLLLGLALEGGGVVAGALEHLGVTLDRVQDVARGLLAERGDRAEDDGSDGGPDAGPGGRPAGDCPDGRPAGDGPDGGAGGPEPAR
jgi:ATP-dependent Clp protease ATP-binding subunit ClpA